MNKFDLMYKGSWLTFLGVDNPEEWKEGLNKLFNEEGIGTVQEWQIFSGDELNSYLSQYEFPSKLTCLSASLEGLDVGKLALWRIGKGSCFEGRWFDDIVDNIKGEENYEDEDEE